MSMRLLTLIGIGLVVALAGCTAPQEADEDGLGNDTDNGAGNGAGAGGTPEAISVNGAVYECDDTIDLDGICDGYERVDEERTDAREVQAGAGGTLTVGGYSFTCDDVDNVDVGLGDDTTAGECERYERDE